MDPIREDSKDMIDLGYERGILTNDTSCDCRRRPDAYKGARHEDHLPRDARAQRLEVPKGTPAKTWLVWKIQERRTNERCLVRPSTTARRL